MEMYCFASSMSRASSLKKDRNHVPPSLASRKKASAIHTFSSSCKPKQRFRFRRFPAPKNWEANIRMQELTPKPTNISRLSICVATVTAPTPPT